MRNRRSDARWRVAALVVALLAAPAAAWAEPPPEGPAKAAAGACDPDTGARLRFLEERLDGERRYARYWWGGWLGFYSLGTIVTSVQAGTEDDRGERANDVVSAVKAAFGVTRLLLDRPIARQGAAPMREIAADSPSGCAARLARGEALLRESAEEARARWSWKRHLSVVGINLAGALIVTQGFDEPRGWSSGGIGIAVGEVMLWSHPWGAAADLEDYERRFAADGMPAPRRISWGIAPSVGGAALHVTF